MERHATCPSQPGFPRLFVNMAKNCKKTGSRYQWAHFLTKRTVARSLKTIEGWERKMQGKGRLTGSYKMMPFKGIRSQACKQEKSAPQIEPRTQTQTCTSLRSRKALQHNTMYGNLQDKCCAPEPRTTLCASLRRRNACQHFTRATLCGNLQEKCCGPAWLRTWTRTLCEPAQSKSTSTLHKSHFIRKFTWQMPRPRT